MRFRRLRNDDLIPQQLFDRGDGGGLHAAEVDQLLIGDDFGANEAFSEIGVDFTGGFYHVIVRGNRRATIFHDAAD